MELSLSRVRASAVEGKEFLPALILYVKKFHDITLLIGLTITRYNKYYYAHSSLLQGDVDVNQLEDIVGECKNIANDNFSIALTCVIANVFHFECNDFFVNSNDLVRVRPLYDVIERLKIAVFRVEDALNDDVKQQEYRVKVAKLKNTILKQNISIGEVIFELISLIRTNVLQVNERWKELISPFFNALTIGCMYMNPTHREKFEGGQEFFSEISEFVNINDLFFDFKCVILPLNIAETFTLYKECAGVFPKLYEKNLPTPGMFWNLCRKNYYDLGTFGYDLLQIPVKPKDIDLDNIAQLVQNLNNDEASKVNLQYLIWLMLNN